MAIGSLRTVVVDCLDPEPLATFWSVLLGVEVNHRSDDWISLHATGAGHPRVAFQRVPESKATKNRLHLDVWVPEIRSATAAAEAIGATCIGGLVEDSGEPYQVLADPAGNEFCLVHLPRIDGSLMQEHNFSVDLSAPPAEVWEVFWYRGPDRPQPPPGSGTSIEILHPGDDVGEGLVRHCHFPVPRILGSGGVGQSWEWLTRVKLHHSWRYDAIGKPLWSRAEGFTRLEDLGDGRTRVHFTERYECFNPWMRRIGLERWVHQKISRDNDAILAALEGGLQWHRRRRARAAEPIPPGSTPVGGAGVTQEAAASAAQPDMDATNEG